MFGCGKAEFFPEIPMCLGHLFQRPRRTVQRIVPIRIPTSLEPFYDLLEPTDFEFGLCNREVAVWTENCNVLQSCHSRRGCVGVRGLRRGQTWFSGQKRGQDRNGGQKRDRNGTETRDRNGDRNGGQVQFVVSLACRATLVLIPGQVSWLFLSPSPGCRRVCPKHNFFRAIGVWLRESFAGSDLVFGFQGSCLNSRDLGKIRRTARTYHHRKLDRLGALKNKTGVCHGIEC